MFFVKQGRLGVELAVDMNNIYNEIDDYLNGNFILGENKEKKDESKSNQYMRKNTFSLMTTFNYTMDDSFILSQERKLDLNYKKPLSFRKRLLKFMKSKLMTHSTNEKRISLNEKNIKYVKLYYIRKGEHFGDIFMFLNKPSCFTLKVKSPKAELLLLKKIDAIEISSNYPNIWKRTNKKSFRNLINLKELVSREMIKFCRKNGIKYKNTNKEVKHSISLPNLEKLKKNKNNHKNDDLRVRFKKFKKSSLIEYNKQRLEKLSSINCNLNQTTINTSILKNNKKFENLMKKEKKKNCSTMKKKEKENKKNNNNIKKITPYEEHEINNEIYKDEMFLETINTNSDNITNIDDDESFFDLYKYYKYYKYEPNDISNDNDKNKTLLKLIDSSRGEKQKDIYCHKIKEKKTNTINNNNYNVHYNIGNSFNINQIQNNTKFNIKQLAVSNCICFKINKIYDNLNILSKGHFHKDYTFQKKIKNLFLHKYVIKKNNNNNNKTNCSANRNIKKAITKSLSVVRSKHTFYKRCSQILPLGGKDSEIKNETNKNMRRRTIEYIKVNKDDKIKKNGKNKDESDIMINRITRNIIAGEQNLNNPNIFYNELFTNIIQNKNTESQSSKMRSIQSRNSIKKRSIKKKSLFLNSAINHSPIIK